MRQIGKVTEVKGNLALVTIKKESSCGDNCASCGMCDTGKMRTAWVYNECGAKEGEEIEIVLESYKTVILAFITYILPLLIFFLSYTFVKNELLSAAILIAAFLICAFSANLLAKKRSFMSKAKRRENAVIDN